jgi:hypothetical protein
VSLEGNCNTTVLQEFCDNAGRTLKVNRVNNTIPNVKLLGTVSAKGRDYPPAVIQRAAPLYEGRPVNVDHVDPGTRRSYRDRIGVIQGVQLREDGLYGTLKFNPKHELAEQLIWDAENAPQNVGFSHDARGPSKLKGGRVVVESIDKVLSIDLVANPATTSGLFEGRDSVAPTPPPPPPPATSPAELRRRLLGYPAATSLSESRDAVTPSFLHRPSQADCEKFVRNIRGSRY